MREVFLERERQRTTVDDHGHVLFFHSRLVAQLDTRLDLLPHRLPPEAVELLPSDLSLGLLLDKLLDAGPYVFSYVYTLNLVAD